MAVAEELAASVELSYLAGALTPPRQVGDFTLTAVLAHTRTALVFTARNAVGSDVVLKVTGTICAPLLARELEVLCECAAVEVSNVVRPLADELVWLTLGGDRPAAALALPYLSGGDLASLADRATRSGQLGASLALAAAMPIANALRGLLCDLSRPLVHGDLRPNNVLLPSASAPLEALTLLDFDQAHPRGKSSEVPAFGALLHLLAGRRTGNKRFERLVQRSLANDYGSMADPTLWRDLREAAK